MSRIHKRTKKIKKYKKGSRRRGRLTTLGIMEGSEISTKQYGLPIGGSPERKSATENNESESFCKYISSKGPQYACDAYNMPPTSDYSTVYCKPDITDINKLLDSIDKKYILVIGQSDFSFPELLGNDSSKYIEDSKCIHIFAQNATITHDKVTSIPIGLNYHSQVEYEHVFGEPSASPKAQEKILQDIKDSSLPFAQRKIMCYANFNSKDDKSTKKFGYDRINAVEQIQKDLIDYQEEEIARTDTWKKQVNYAFVISPHGNGLDCHRQWEALCLGCIPIVVTSPIDILYKDLPVLIVQKWSDITPELLKDTVNKFKDMKFDYNKLLLSYWVDKINSFKKH